jgi:hypothetical protein
MVLRMSWRAKHLYSVLVVAFLLYLGIGLIFYPPILTRYWIPVLVSLYLLAYLGLPLLRKLTQKNSENPSLQKIADIMNEALNENPSLNNFRSELDSFSPDNAYVRLVNDYIFREYASEKVYDRIKDSVANYYFYCFTGWAFGAVAILSVLGLALNLIFFLSQGRFLTRPLFTGLSPQTLAVAWFVLIFILGGLSVWFSIYFRSAVADAEKKRAQNLYMLLISSRKKEIKALVARLADDEDLQAIAAEKLRVP